ncbi:MAG TPA: ATP-binding protein [Actinoplanes sp.]|nr:ATP-binding protein [Actinoplanes sp.]
MSLRARLAVMFGAGVSLVLLVALSLLYIALHRQLDAAVDADLRNRGDDLIAALPSRNIAVVRGDPMAQLYAADGTVLASSTALADRILLRPDQVTAGKTTVLLSGRRVRLVSRPAGDNGEILTVGQPLSTVEGAGTRQLVVLAIATPVLIAMLFLIGWFLVRAALRPVDRLTREAAAISTFDSDRRLPVVTGDDEIARLAATLNGMLSRLSVAFARERAFVDDASHELRTPIAIMRGEIELALSAAGDPDEVRRSLVATQRQAARLGRLAEDMLLLARERAGALGVLREPVDLTDLAHVEARALGPLTGVAIEVRGDPVIVEADAGRIRQVLANLAANSAAAGAATVLVTVLAEGVGARLEWADDGPGFPPGLLDRAFERFVRGDPSRPSTTGAGLGLSIVRAVVTAHGGEALLRNGPPRGGAVITVRLPAP